jgi:hypothetical protein
MKKILAVLFALVVVGVAGAVVVLASIDLPAPTQRMEIPVPNERLAR